MNATRLTLLLSCILSAMTCAATKYQIKVLNTPTITIDNRQAKVGDWFDDTSVISWTKENQAMRVLSDENKVYTLSAKLYKEAKAKKFSDFIAYIKPLAVRGANDDSLIAQLQERFDQDFIMLDEIVIDLSGIDLPMDCQFLFESIDGINENNIVISTHEGVLNLCRSFFLAENQPVIKNIAYKVIMHCPITDSSIISESMDIIFYPINLN